jgi:hypothetical protein
MNFLTEKLGFEPELNRGLIASVVFHVALFLFAWFGVPHLFEDEFITEPLGIEAAIVSDLTAAPKVDKPSKKVSEKPKQTQKAEPPKKEAKPAAAKENPKPAATTPPPPPPEEVAVAIPDKEKPKEVEKVEKKPDEPKVEDKSKKKPDDKDKKKKDKKPVEDDFTKLLESVTPDQAAEPTPEKTKPKAAPPPEESTGPQTELASEVPMTSGDEDGIRSQIEQNWNLGSAAGAPNLDQILVELRITMLPDGTVTTVELLNNQSDPFFQSIAEGAIRAVKRASPLKMPPGKFWPTIKLRFRPSEVI